MKAQYKFIYNRKDTLDSDGKALVQLQVYFDRTHRKLVSTKIYITPEQWDPKKNHIRPSEDMIEKYDLLNNMVRDLEAYEMVLIRKGERLTPGKADEFFKNERAVTFNDFIEKELKSDTVLKYGTTKGHWVMLRKLNEFQPVIAFDDISYDLVDRFDKWLHTKDLAVNTIADHHKVLRRYIEIAIKKDLINSNQHPYRGKFKVKRESTEMIIPSDEDIQALEDLDYTDSPKYEAIRDRYLFCCYSGLRISDLLNLQTKHLQQSPEGWEIMLHKMIKVPQPVFIPLHMLFRGRGQEILLKYMDGRDYIFEGYSEPKCREYLKVIVRAAKIKKHLKWHSSRHYFGSSLAARYNDPFLIMQLMGHSEIKTSMIYIHSSQEIIKSKLKRIEW